MKLLESKIYNLINYLIDNIQNKTDDIRKNSFFLLNIDTFILIAILFTYLISIFCSTEVIGIISILPIILVVFKVLITKGEKLELEHCNFYLLIYLLICFISNFTSSMPIQSLYGFMKTFIYISFYFALCQFLKTNQKYLIILIGFIAALVSFESIAGIFQNIFGVESISTWQDTSYVNPEDVISRVYGTLKPYNPNLLGGYLIAGVSCVVGIFSILLINIKKNQWYKYILIPSFLAMFISFFAIFLTGCRGAYVALFVMMLSYIVASFRIVFSDIDIEKLKIIWKSAFALFCASVVGFLALNHAIFQRLMSIFIFRVDSSTSFRVNVYNSAVQMFQDNWLYGIGVGNKVFREIYGLYMLSGFDALSCYCVFLEMAVESGILSLIAYILFLYILLSSAIKYFIKSKDLNYKILLAVGFIAIIGVMIHGFVDTIYFRPQVQYIFWTMAAIITVIVRENKTAE